MVQHDDSYGCTFYTRGNSTTVTTYSNAAAQTGLVARHASYDVFGNLRTADVNGTQQQSIAYGAGTNYAYPDSVTLGTGVSPQLTTSATYNSYTGLVSTVTDENSKVTTFAYDSMKRVTSVTKSDGGTTIAKKSYAYDDTARIITVSTPLEGTFASPTKTIVEKSYFDTLGRPFRQEIRDQANGLYTTVDENYDALGRAFRKSNPYTTSAQYWTETRTDALGRVTFTHLVDSTAGWAVQSGNSTTSTYSLKTVTTTDPAGKARKSEADALGRSVKVFEPDIANPTQLTKETWYTYNVLDLLTLVSYPSPDNVQSRTFVYDDLGQLTQQTTPEAGTWSYTYNNFGQVLTRTDARIVITSYTYDTLNRPYTVSYNVGSSGVPATNTVTYTYGTTPASNNNGRLTQVTNTTATQNFTYDALGRVTQDSKVINGTTYNTVYTYGNLSDALTQVTYPSGRVVKQDFDAIGRLAKLYKDGTTKYADAFGYNAAGQNTGFTYGNGVVASYGFSSDRLQMTSLSYVKTGTTLFAANYYYKLDASNCPTGSATGNNGQIQCIKDTVDNGRSVAYTYDALYRLSNAATTGSVGYPAWGLSWTYDRYGNRTAQSTSSGCSGVTCPTNSVTINPATNRLTDPGYTYDANGNMTNDGANALGYDAENHMVTAAGWAYVADGAGLRVRRCTPNCTSPTSNTVYIFNGAQVIAEYDNGAAVGSPTREYIYLGDRKLAVYFGSTITYYHWDHLSNRRMSNSSGSGTTQLGNFPFGEAWYGTGAKWRFTSYERDTESGNDYATMRSYVNRLGRFSSPDPGRDSAWDPQQLNRYAYVSNDPVNFADSKGLQRERRGDQRGDCDGCRFWGLWDLIRETGGNDIFDALAGAPGTYIYVDMYGYLSWGFSPELWVGTWNLIDAARARSASNIRGTPLIRGFTVQTTGYQTYVRNFGVDTTVSGILVDQAELAARHSSLASQFNAIALPYLETLIIRISDGMEEEKAWKLFWLDLKTDPRYKRLEPFLFDLQRDLDRFVTLYGYLLGPGQ